MKLAEQFKKSVVAVFCLSSAVFLTESVHCNVSVQTASPQNSIIQADTVNYLLRLPLPEKMSFCGEEVPLGYENTIERLEYELIISLGAPITTAMWFKRASRYFSIIESMAREMGVPEDLKYVAVIESDLRSEAVSTASAVGPWQFISSTGRMCGLDQNDCLDERKDWEKSTRAALGHLSDLKQRLGSWFLALAAYNAGPGRIVDASLEQGESSYFALKLPRETERYVFRALAAKLIMENPALYGIRLEGARLYGVEDIQVFNLNVPQTGLSILKLAKAADVSYRRLRELNPWLNGQTLPRGIYQLKLPAGSLVGLEDKLTNLFATEKTATAVASVQPSETQQVYIVQKGDTLIQVARQHKVMVDEIKKWNRLSTSTISPGQRLVIK